MTKLKNTSTKCNCAPSSGYRGAHPRWAGPHPVEAGVRGHIGSVLSRGRGYTRGRGCTGQQVTLALLLHLNLLQPEVSHISFPWITQLLDRQPSKLQQPSSSRLQKWRSDPNITREHHAKLKEVAERFWFLSEYVFNIYWFITILSLSI